LLSKIDKIVTNFQKHDIVVEKLHGRVMIAKEKKLISANQKEVYLKYP